MPVMANKKRYLIRENIMQDDDKILASIQSITNLKSKIVEAASSGDDIAFNDAIREYNKHKAEVQKAIQAQIAKENEELAQIRESFEKENTKALIDFVKSLGFDPYKYKAKTILITVPHKMTEDGKIDKSGSNTSSGGVKISVPTVKTKRQSSGGGGTNKTKQEYGKSMAEIVEEFGTDDEKADAAALKSMGRTDRADSKLYALQLKIKNRAINEGLLKPIS